MSEDKAKNDFGTHYTWGEVWTAVLTRPGVATFEEILSDPDASKDRAYKWVFWTGTIGILATQIITTFNLMSIYGSRGYTLNFGAMLPAIGCSLVLGGLFVLIGFVISSVITQFFARLLGGTGSYSAFHYAYASFYAPLMMVNVAISAFTLGTTSLTLVGLVSLALAIYQFVLMAMAIKTVNQFGWGKAILTMFMPLITFIVVIFGVFSLLGTWAVMR